jgi:hypothetical protein
MLSNKKQGKNITRKVMPSHAGDFVTNRVIISQQSHSVTNTVQLLHIRLCRHISVPFVVIIEVKQSHYRP